MLFNQKYLLNFVERFILHCNVFFIYCIYNKMCVSSLKVTKNVTKSKSLKYHSIKMIKYSSNV